MRVALDAVSKRFGRIRALDVVSFSIEPGEIVAVLGVNGAGKTTLLRALGGIVAPDRGAILFDGERFHRGRIDLRKRHEKVYMGSAVVALSSTFSSRRLRYRVDHNLCRIDVADRDTRRRRHGGLLRPTLRGLHTSA